MAVDVDRHPIAWRESGPTGGHLVALLHGLEGSRLTWEPQLDVLGEAGYHAAAWDMPGYGASDPTDVLSFPQLADAVAGWLEELGASAHIVGTSIGGMIALHVAVRHPSLVRSLTLAGASPAFLFDGRGTPHEWVHDRLALLRAEHSRADLARELIDRAVHSPNGDRARAAATAAMSRVNVAGMEAAVHCLPTHDVRNELEGIRCPTLVIVGEHDRETPVSDAEHLAGHIPGARLAVVADAGHLSNLEQPDAFNRLLLDHLATAP